MVRLRDFCSFALKEQKYSSFRFILVNISIAVLIKKVPSFPGEPSSLGHHHNSFHPDAVFCCCCSFSGMVLLFFAFSLPYLIFHECVLLVHICMICFLFLFSIFHRVLLYRRHVNGMDIQAHGLGMGKVVLY